MSNGCQQCLGTGSMAGSLPSSSYMFVFNTQERFGGQVIAEVTQVWSKASLEPCCLMKSEVESWAMITPYRPFFSPRNLGRKLGHDTPYRPFLSPRNLGRKLGHGTQYRPFLSPRNLGRKLGHMPYRPFLSPRNLGRKLGHGTPYRPFLSPRNLGRKLGHTPYRPFLSPRNLDCIVVIFVQTCLCFTKKQNEIEKSELHWKSLKCVVIYVRQEQEAWEDLTVVLVVSGEAWAAPWGAPSAAVNIIPGAIPSCRCQRTLSPVLLASNVLSKAKVGLVQLPRLAFEGSGRCRASFLPSYLLCTGRAC
nr:uncharacterized protein LOC110568251 [Aotus nancymaae]